MRYSSRDVGLGKAVCAGATLCKSSVGTRTSVACGVVVVQTRMKLIWESCPGELCVCMVCTSVRGCCVGHCLLVLPVFCGVETVCICYAVVCVEICAVGAMKHWVWVGGMLIGPGAYGVHLQVLVSFCVCTCGSS